MAPMAEHNDKLKLVTKEVVICKLLTSNDSKVRNLGLKTLKKWFGEIGSGKGVEEDDFNRIWNGLFYYVWMSDKPLIQEEAVERISGMMHHLNNFQASMYYIRGFFNALLRQWDRISHHRIDKFLMFIRRFLRQILTLLKNHEWNIEKLELFSIELYNAMQVLPYSLALHLNEIFNEEVAKVSKGEIPTEALVVLYKGYIECIVNLRPTMQVVNSIQSSIFCGLIRQLKLHIKQKVLAESCDDEDNAEHLGSDTEKMNALETESCDNEDNVNEEIALDPRPGGVDVFLPYIDFNEKMFIKYIEQYSSKLGIHIKAKNILNQIITMLASISKLRSSNPDVLIHEMIENSKKKKKSKKAMSKLIKKSCNRLEDDDEMEAERDERVLKKLSNMTDLIQIPAGKSTFTVVQTKPKNTATKRSSISNEWVVTKTTEKPSPPKKAKISGDKNDWVVESIPKDEEKSASLTEQSELINENEECNDADIHLEIADENENSSSGLFSDEPATNKDDDQATTDKREFVSVSVDKELTQSIKEEIVDSEAVGKKFKNKSPKRSLSVSFSEKPTRTYYEDDGDKRTRVCDAESEIIVPASVIKEHPNLMIKDRDYVVVDFKPEIIVDKVSHQRHSKKIPQEPETVTRTLRSRKVESTPTSISTPEAKRTRKPREKKSETSVQRKSTRIAEKQKKVLFKLEENTYQDIPAYEKVLRSKPASPFDVSKSPNCGILKPFAVTSPINPFYFASGERKLKRKRK